MIMFIQACYLYGLQASKVEKVGAKSKKSVISIKLVTKKGKIYICWPVLNRIKRIPLNFVHLF